MIGNMVCLKGYPEFWGMITAVDKDEVGEIWEVWLKLEIKTIVKSYSTNFDPVQRLQSINLESKVTDTHHH